MRRVAQEQQAAYGSAFFGPEPGGHKPGVPRVVGVSGPSLLADGVQGGLPAPPGQAGRRSAGSRSPLGP